MPLFLSINLICGLLQTLADPCRLGERGFKAKPSFPDLRWSVPWPLFPFKTLAVSAVTLGSLALGSLPTVSGQEVTLRVHTSCLGPPPCRQFIAPWEAAVEDASNGRIEIEVYHAMALGGSAPQLYDQVVDGAVDIILTLPGYTLGASQKQKCLNCLSLFLTRLHPQALFMN